MAKSLRWRVHEAQAAARCGARLTLVRALAVLAVVSGLAACDPRGPASETAAPASTPQTRAQVYEAVRKKTALGRQLFFDASLSGSGKLACASCHSPDHAFGPPNALPAQFGGRDMKQPGFRAVPSLRYLQSVPSFVEHFHESDDDGDESIDAGPTGGLTWDGRVDRRAAQARIPLISPFEMASSSTRVARAVRAAPYARAFRDVYGAQVLDDDAAAFDAVLDALAVYEQMPAVFEPYSSKYDAYLAGRASLSPAELRGLRLFEDERKGNCASCHPSEPTASGAPPQFTDFGLIALGAPRNEALAVNRDPHFFDLGACGPLRTDLQGRDEFCGLFRTPTLRNVATRHTFFHNGIYRSLEDVLRFYVERDIYPEKFYRVVAGRAHKFDDLPQRYWGNVNTDPPFDRRPGDTPALDNAEIRDVVAFLGTLTDGYREGAGEASPTEVAR